MMSPWNWCLALPLLITAAQDGERAGWKAFVSKEGRFQVQMPTAPAEQKQRVKTATGQVEVHLFLAEGSAATFVLSYSDFPANEVKAGDEAKRLDFARDGAVSSARGKLRSERKIDLDGVPGRELVIDGASDTVLKVRVYAAERRLYQLMAVGPGAILGSKESAAFLDSFRLLK